MLLTNRLLQMSVLELQQCVSQEVADNPALEWPEELCAACRSVGRSCLDCPLNPGAGPRPAVWDHDFAPWEEGSNPADPYEYVSVQETLAHHLRAQLFAGVAECDQGVGQYLIDSIDSDGYLRSDVEEAARVLEVHPAEVERVLKVIQTFEPTGVGARNLRECLLIQTEARASDPATPVVVLPILTAYWKELSTGKWRAIARGLRVSQAEVEGSIGWLRRNLSPYPGLCFRPHWERTPQGSAAPARPDAIVSFDEGGRLRLRLPGEEGPGPVLNSDYSRTLVSIREKHGTQPSPEERNVEELVVRAQMLLKGLHDRVCLLRRVGECLLEEQEQYLRSEREEDLRPLTQAQLAAFIQVHESTVSRAVAEKFLQLPSGRVLPLSFFFDRAVSYRRLVANVVAGEDPAAPYSDQEISDRLRREGVFIARRTVMKYREELGILSSRQRARTPGSCGTS